MLLCPDKAMLSYGMCPESGKSIEFGFNCWFNFALLGSYSQGLVGKRRWRVVL